MENELIKYNNIQMEKVCNNEKSGNQPPQLTINIDKALSIDKKITLKKLDRVDVKALLYILHMDNNTYETKYMKISSEKYKTSLPALKQWAKKNIENATDGYVDIPVNYEARPNKPLGRLYAKDGINVQYMSKPLRGILLDKYNKDFDIVNCWFNIALGICQDYKAQGGSIKFPLLKSYVANRKKIIENLELTYEDGKEIFTSIFNSDKYICGINDEFLLDFHAEKCKYINTIINDEEYLSNFDSVDTIRNSPNLNSQNIESSQMWYIISIMESKIVLDKMKDITHGTYLWDGFTHLKETPFEEVRENGIEWTHKPMEVPIEFTTWEPKNKYLEKVYNAVHGSMHVKSATFSIIADWLLSEVGNRFAYCDKSIYKCNSNNVWKIVDNGDGDVQQLLTKHILPHIKKEQCKQQEKCSEDPSDKYSKAILKKWNVIIDYISGDAGWLAFKNILVGKSKMENEKFPEKLDLLKEHICFANKKYNLKTGEWSDILPEDYISITTGYDYEEPTQDVIDKLNEMYLNKIFVDSADREHFMKSMCAVLDGNIRRRKMNIFTNAGSNGKSVMADLMKHMLGKYHSSAKSTMVQRSKSSSGSADPDMFRLKNCRMVQLNEPDKGEKMNSAYIKELTGGDCISARQCHSNQIVEFKPTASLCMLANDIPPLDVTDPATLGRMNVIPFNSTFRSDITKDDWENKEFVRDNKVLELESYNEVKIAMFNEIVKYYSMYLSNTEWSHSSELGQEYMDSQDFVKQLLDTYTEKVTGDERVNVKDLYQLMKMDDTFKEHCPSSQRKFNGILRNKALKIEKSHGDQVIRGFKLKSSENEIECMIDDLDC